MIHHTLLNYLYGFLIIVLQFFLPIKELAIILILAVLIDTGFGIYRSKKLGVKVTSHRLFKNLVTKLGLYILSLIGVFFIDKFIICGDLFGIELFLSKSITIIYTFIEIKSIDESSVMCGNKSIWKIIEEIIAKIISIKKDIKKLEKINKKATF